MNRSEKITAATVQYGLSLLSGLAMFAGLKVLQHIAPSNEVFSRLSLILLSFTTFQIITDLGTQTEFLRTYQHAPDTRRGALCRILIQTRLFLGLIAFCMAGLYALASNFSQQMFFAFLLYHFAFVPFAFISTTDSIFLARREFTKAIFSRIGRLVSLAIFLSIAAVSAREVEIFSPLFSSLAFTLVAVLVWFKFLKPIMIQHTFPATLSAASMPSLLSRHWWKLSEADSKKFIQGSAFAALIMGLQTFHGISAHSTLVRTLGEDNLTPLNTATALATPAILAFQTLVQMINPNIPAWMQLSSRDLLARYTTFFLRSSALLILMSAGLWSASSLGLVAWFFPMTTYAVMPMCQFLIVAQWALNLAVPAVYLCQYQRQYVSLSLLLGFSVVTALLMQFWWNRLLLEQAYLMGLFIMGIIPTVGATILSLRVQRFSKASS